LAKLVAINFAGTRAEMRKITTLTTAFLLHTSSHARQFSDGDDGLVVYLIGALVLIGFIFFGSALGWLIETINRLTGKAGDNEFASKVLMVGGFGSPMIGGIMALMFGTKANFTSDFFTFTVVAFAALAWWFYREP
jgi:hypothetical protein